MTTSPFVRQTQDMERQKELTGFASVLRCRLLNESIDQIADTLPTRLRALISSGDVSALTTNPVFTDAVVRASVVGTLADLATSATVGSPILAAPDTLALADVSEGQPIPAAQFSVNAAPLLPRKFAVILAFDKRALVSPAPRVRQQFDRALRAAASRGLDAAVVNGLLADATNVPGTLADLVAAVNPLVPVFITSLPTLTRLATSTTTASAFANVASDGSLWGAPMLLVPAATDRVLLIDAADLALAVDGIEVTVGPAASLEMSDAPTNSSVPPVGAQLVSMWQTNSVSVKLQAFVSWQATTTNALAYQTVGA